MNKEQNLPTNPNTIIEARNMNFYYGNFRAVKDVNIQITANKITAIIGPSGCGKSTVLRSFNRMNDFVRGSKVQGEILYLWGKVGWSR